MKNKLPKALHNGEVDLNGFKITSAVLDDGRRIFSERSLANAFGIKGGGAYWEKKKQGKDESAFLPEYLSAGYLNDFISNDLKEKFKGAVLYVTKTGQEANGIDATALADICDVYITAKNSGKIKNQKFLTVADNAYIMLKAFAKVGIIALVDEATGYQDVRMKDELNKILLRELLLDSAKPYQLTFPLELYKQWFRLNNWEWKPENAQKRPGVIGTWTNQYVYDKIHDGLLKEFEIRNPKNEKGYREFKNFQFVTDEVGEPKLREMFGGLIALAKANTSWRRYIEMVNMVYPKTGDQLRLDMPDGK